jgi:hypothetical protein
LLPVRPLPAADLDLAQYIPALTRAAVWYSATFGQKVQKDIIDVTDTSAARPILRPAAPTQAELAANPLVKILVDNAYNNGYRHGLEEKSTLMAKLVQARPRKETKSSKAKEVKKTKPRTKHQEKVRERKNKKESSSSGSDEESDSSSDEGSSSARDEKKGVPASSHIPISLPRPPPVLDHGHP